MPPAGQPFCLPWSRVGAVPSASVSVHGDQYSWCLGQDGDGRTGRRCILALHDHLAIVTKCQDPAFAAAAHLARQEPVMRVVCHNIGCELAEFNGDDNTSACSSPSLDGRAVPAGQQPQGVSSRWLRQEFPELARHHRRAKRLCSASYFAGSVGADDDA